MSEKKKKDAEQLLVCLPGPAGWELWQSAGGVPFQLAESAPGVLEGGGPDAFKAATHFGVPVAQAFSVPLWVASEDPELVRDALSIQLETLGLQPEVVEGQHVSSRIIAHEDKRSLVSVRVLPDAFATDLPRQQAPGHFEISADLLPLPDSQVSVWMELGKLAFAVTRLDEVVYFQGLTADRLDAEAAREIAFAVMQLRSQGVADQVDGVTVWLPPADADDAALDGLRAQVGAPVVLVDRPPPEVPLEPSGLMPEQVAAADRLAKRRAQVRNGVGAAVAAYLVLVAAVLGYSWFKNRSLDRLKDEVARLEQEAGWVPSEQARWLAFQETIDPELYPLETLRRIYELMPPTGVRFKQYQDSKTNVRIQAEAQDTNAAIRFRNAVANSSELSRYRWESTQPRVGRNRTTEFTLSGTLKEEEDPAL